MKIAFLNIYQNKVNRGAETYVHELSRRLSKNHTVRVFTKLNFKELFSKFDIVVPTNGRLQVFIVRIITWLSGAKMIVSGQSGIGLDDRINLYCFPDAFVPLSTTALKWSKKINPLVKSHHIPNGVDLNKFKVGNSNVSNVVLSVGAFTNEKRHELTIKAVSKLENIKLIIVGGGGDKKAETENLGISMLGKDRFEVLSATHDQMPEIYKNASVLAYTTVAWESFGIAMLEAMASGLPVVATDDPIRREIVGDAGYFVDPIDSDAYAKTLEKALNTSWGDKQSLAKSEFGKPRKQAEKFDWDKIALKYEALFESLV